MVDPGDTSKFGTALNREAIPLAQGKVPAVSGLRKMYDAKEASLLGLEVGMPAVRAMAGKVIFKAAREGDRGEVACRFIPEEATAPIAKLALQYILENLPQGRDAAVLAPSVAGQVSESAELVLNPQVFGEILRGREKRLLRFVQGKEVNADVERLGNTRRLGESIQSEKLGPAASNALLLNDAA